MEPRSGKAIAAIFETAGVVRRARANGEQRAHSRDDRALAGVGAVRRERRLQRNGCGGLCRAARVCKCERGGRDSREFSAPGLRAFGKYARGRARVGRSEEHTSELQSRLHLVCRLLLEKK